MKNILSLFRTAILSCLHFGYYSRVNYYMTLMCLRGNRVEVEEWDKRMRGNGGLGSDGRGTYDKLHCCTSRKVTGCPWGGDVGTDHLDHPGRSNLSSRNHLSHRIQDPVGLDNGKLRSNQCELRAKGGISLNASLAVLHELGKTSVVTETEFLLIW